MSWSTFSFLSISKQSNMWLDIIIALQTSSFILHSQLNSTAMSLHCIAMWDPKHFLPKSVNVSQDAKRRQTIKTSVQTLPDCKAWDLFRWRKHFLKLVRNAARRKYISCHASFMFHSMPGNWAALEMRNCTYLFFESWYFIKVPIMFHSIVLISGSRYFS